METSEESLIDFKILNFINPPPTYPPSAYDISSEIEQKFYNECLYFLKSQRKMYECSKKIQTRLENSISDSASLDQRVKQRAAKLQKINRELNKINQHYNEVDKRQSFLSQICKFINMEEARKILLQPKITDETEFIKKLKEIDDLAQQVKNLQSDVKIISEIKEQLSSLLQQATNKLIKGNISENLLQKIISEYAYIFLRDPKVSAVFISNLTNQRLNFFRIALNPLINNVNYAQNVAELYEKIVEQWIKMLDNEMKIFCKEEAKPQIKSITKQVMNKLLAQVMPKMERGIYKVKNLVVLSKIRFQLSKLKKKLDQCGDSTWDPVPKVLVKTLGILQETLDQEADELSIAKYNIYSLASYVPIREHLQEIKQAKHYDCSDSSKIQIDWERGFKKLVQSRDPSKQPNNKSLLIFNLNIWYLYNNVMKAEGLFKEQAEKMIKEGIFSIVNLNMTTVKKQYESKSLEKLLDICADCELIKRNLYAEVNLLGHEKLRTAVEQGLAKFFITDIYEPMIKQNNFEKGAKSGQVIELCKKQKINLNKYGKQAENLKIYTVEEFQQLLNN